MHFLSFCYRNVLRRKARSSLTACAVAIAVAAVVALVGVSTGFRRDFINHYEEMGIDLMVVGNASSINTLLDESYYDQIKSVDGVVEVIPGLLEMTSFSEYNLIAVPISGLTPNTRVFDHYDMTSGRPISEEDGRVVMLGSTLAQTLDKKAGDLLEVMPGTEPFEVVGVFDSFSVIDNGTIIMSVKQLQEFMDRQGEVSGFSVVAKDNSAAALDRMIAELKAIDPDRIQVRRAREHIEEQPQVKAAVGMAWITSAIAMVIGTLGMLNTMLMSLQERIGEIGLLRAVGWTRSRIAKMILGESVLLSVLGGVVGVVAAFLMVEILTRLPIAKGFISGQIDARVVIQGLIIAVGVGVVGGLLPALNATRLAPAEALRQ